jgi:hypothetical protein
MSVFRFEVDIRTEDGYVYLLASPEKAICDKLYTCSPCANRAELKDLLFEDLKDR